MSKGEEKDKERGSVIVTAASLIAKKFGRSIEPAGDKFKDTPKAISTGSLKLDTAIGECAGYPLGSVIEVFGWEGAGKTLMLYLAFAEAQRQYPNKPCVLIDAERQFKFQAKWAAKVGVDVSKLIVMPCSTAEECFDIAHALVLGKAEVEKKTGEVIKVIEPGNYSIIGIDSVTQLVSIIDASKGMEESRQRGTQASAIGLGLKKVASAMARSDVNSDTILFFINQLRKNPNKSFGNPEYRTGGNALPFYDTLALKVAKVWDSDERDDNGEILSHQVKVTFEKNKAGSLPEEAIVFTLMHDGSGVNNEEELFDVALQNGLLKEYEVTKRDGKVVLRYNFVDEKGEKLDEDMKDFAKRSFDSVLAEHPDIDSKIRALMAERKIFVKKDSVKEDVPDSAVKDPEASDEAETAEKSEDSTDDEGGTEISRKERREARRQKKLLKLR
jgi:recombination protein RecA